MEQSFPKCPTDTLVRVSGKNLDGSAGDYYAAVIGANANTSITDEGWIRLTSGWIFVRIPHGNPGVPGTLWDPLRWPWVIGAGVRAGVSGYTAQDFVIVTIEGAGPQRIFYGATSGGGNSSIGKYQAAAGVIDVDPQQKCLEVSGGLVTPRALDAGLLDYMGGIRTRAEELLNA